MSPARLGVIISIWASWVLGMVSTCYAELYPKHHPVPGGIAVVGLNISSKQDVIARFGRTRILTVKDEGFWYGIVGIELDAAQGNYLITASTSSEDPIVRQFSVGPYSYPLRARRNTKSTPGPIVTPDAWRPQLDAVFPLLPPVTTSKIVPFGTRYANADDAGPEQWVAFFLNSSQDVVAPGQGIVVDVSPNEEEETLYVTIDHGMGLYSSLGPMKQLQKGNGKAVERGEVLGEFEYQKTLSRAVYWKTKLNGVAVDPLLFIERAKAE